MSFKDKLAVQRIFNTFTRLKSQIFKEDVEAMKQLQSSLEYYKNQSIDNNQLYAVVLALLIRERLSKGQSINSTLHMIGHDVKAYNLSCIIRMITAKLNVAELQEFMSQKEITVPKGKDIYKDTDELLDLWHKEHDKEFMQKILQSWSYDEVKDNFYNTANELIKNFEPIK